MPRFASEVRVGAIGQQQLRHRGVIDVTQRWQVKKRSIGVGSECQQLFDDVNVAAADGQLKRQFTITDAVICASAMRQQQIHHMWITRQNGGTQRAC